jgi:hypothetical protein
MNTNLIIAGYKARAAAKVNSLADSIIYNIARAERAGESDGEVRYFATKRILASVSPARSKNKLGYNYNGDAYFKLNQTMARLAKRLPEHWRGVLETEDQEQIQEIVKDVQLALTRHYLYIFVRQDMSMEQQAVQAAHATFVAGAAIRTDHTGNARRKAPFNPDYTHFVMLGVPDLESLLEAQQLAIDANVGMHPFYEGAMNDELTAFTTGIVTQENRHHFAGYKLLKFGVQS